MFNSWGRLVYSHRRLVLFVMVVVLLVGGFFGLSLPGQLSQSGYDDPNSESTRAAQIADAAYGRDHNSDVIVVYTAPEGTTVDDPAFADTVSASLEKVQATFPNDIGAITSYWNSGITGLATPDRRHAFASVALTGTTDTQTLNQYQDLKGQFDIPGVQVEVSGLQPIGDAIGVGMDNDTQRAELIALPAVAILLFFVFGGVIAALLPVIIGVLTIAGATGVMWALSHFMDINTFAQPVVTLIGLGLAIDYGLFIVSRFREELAEGYATDAAVRRSVATAGRTVVFSATMLVASFTGLLMFPQGFLRSVALGGLFAIAIAALTSLTVLPAILGMLGTRVDAWSLPFLNRTKTNHEIETGFWGKLTDWVCKHPAWVATPIIIVMLALIVPFKNIAFGGLSETYLPPDNPTRVAQEHFDELFPTFRTDPVNIVVTGATDQQLGEIYQAANEVPGFTGPFQAKPTVGDVNMLSAGLIDTDNPGNTINELRAIPAPEGVHIYVGGVPALTQDTINTLGDRLPWMVLYIVIVTTILMFLAFGSLVLPIKAVLMSALGLGSTLGILTWIFIDGHGAGLLNFTPGPLMAAVLVLLLAIIFGLSTDYEVFLISRMVEARENGASTKEAIRIGTAHTGRIITAAALILIVVTGAFGFSEIVMMKYIAYGMISALILDATVIRMLLVPAVMTMLGDDCWWAPKWMKRIQERIGLGEMRLPPEPASSFVYTPLADTPGAAPAGTPVAVGASAVPDAASAMPDGGVVRPATARPAAGSAAPAPEGAAERTLVIPRITVDQTPSFSPAADKAAATAHPAAAHPTTAHPELAHPAPARPDYTAASAQERQTAATRGRPEPAAPAEPPRERAERARPRYPWEVRPTAPSRDGHGMVRPAPAEPEGGAGDERSDRRADDRADDRVDARADDWKDSREAGDPAESDATAAESAGTRHRRADADTQVTVAELMRRYRGTEGDDPAR